MTRVLLLFTGLAMAQETTPADVIDFVRSLGMDLASAHPDPLNRPDQSPKEFLDHFDPAMAGFETLRQEVEELTARSEVGSVIEIAADSGGDRKRTMQLDWVLEIQDRSSRRQLVKCAIEKKGRKWTIVAFEPIEFFKY